MTHAERAAAGRTAGDQARIGQALSPTDSEAADRRARVSSPDDCLRLLLWAAANDQRERGPGEATAWFEALQPYEFAFDDVKAAITKHYRRSTYPVMPANVIQIIEDGIEA
ncbi:hypothetical protein ACFWHR_04020 [Leucobacter sp. NPDC058333]|uniref:hypothetical protein n=1 Tax=Leucobacter sp. NPDC058333 TaxID=3346450 RepID=UPI00364774FF